MANKKKQKLPSDDEVIKDGKVTEALLLLEFVKKYDELDAKRRIFIYG